MTIEWLEVEEIEILDVAESVQEYLANKEGN